MLGKLDLALLLFSLLGSISEKDCCSPRQPTLYEEPPNIRIDGGWNSWSSWSDCSEECLVQGTAYKGVQTRSRLCNNPYRLGDGNDCSGDSKQVTPCKNDIPTCPPPQDGNWSSWGTWLICSRTCSLYGESGLQYRSRACNNPTAKFGGRKCPGNSSEIRECKSLKECDVNGGFSEWKASPCEPKVINQPCSEGSQDLKRSCTNPKPNGNGNLCNGRTIKVQDCWYQEGCREEMQKVTEVTYFRNKENLEISWRRPPFGEQPTGFRIIYYPLESVDRKKSFLVNLKEKEAFGERYTKKIEEKLKLDQVYRFSIESFNSKTSEIYYFPVRIGPVDGRWSEWGFWSDCSEKCKSGTKTRRRKCNNPPQSKDGKSCPGPAEQSEACFGMC